MLLCTCVVAAKHFLPGVSVVHLFPFMYSGKGTEEGPQETSPEANENGSRWLTVYPRASCNAHVLTSPA